LSLVLGPDHAPLSKRHGATSVAEFRERGFLPEALVNYLALLGWSPGEGEEILPVAEMARRFDVTKVSHSAAVFDVPKLSWMSRQYMRTTPPPRLARDCAPYLIRAKFLARESTAALAYVETLLTLAVGSVDRLDEIPERVAFVFAWEPTGASALVAKEPRGLEVIAALLEELADAGSLDRERFRAAAGRVKDRTGLKGRALFHPIRVALTGADSGPELDLALPVIDAGAALSPAAGVAPIVSCVDRARLVAGVRTAS
jgi:glutamyl-tRNA synthetase/nondiscriminating glutamyl-tRNA synthetase